MFTKMLNHNVLVKEVETVSNSGLILDNSVQSYKRVEVVLFPENIEFLTKGKIVYIPKFSGMDIKFDNTEYLIIDVREIILEE